MGLVGAQKPKEFHSRLINGQKKGHGPFLSKEQKAMKTPLKVSQNTMVIVHFWVTKFSQIQSKFSQNSVTKQLKFIQNAVKNQSKFILNAALMQRKCSQNPVKIQSKSSQNSVKIQSKFSQNSVKNPFFSPYFSKFVKFLQRINLFIVGVVCNSRNSPNIRSKTGPNPDLSKVKK